MKAYKVGLLAKGALTQLPDSQKLFGALVYMYSERYGSEEATLLVKAVLEKKGYLALSNVTPLDYLPVPQDYIMDCIFHIGGTELNLKQKHEALKKRSYLKREQLEQILNEPGKCDRVFPYIKLQNQQQLRASIDSIRYDIPELDSKLYSVPTITVREITSEDEENAESEAKPIHCFCFYLQVDDGNMGVRLLDMLKDAANRKKSVILGKRASQGMNIFEFIDVTEESLPRIATDAFLNMGMLLPDNINFSGSFLKLFTSERRPFEMAGGWEEKFQKQYISFIAEGSVIKAPNGVMGAGKSIESPFNRERDVVFGNAFMYPILLQERRVKP